MSYRFFDVYVAYTYNSNKEMYINLLNIIIDNGEIATDI